MGNRRIYQLSVDLTIEWNFSSSFGFIFGSWFSLYGCNSYKFLSISIDLYFPSI
jgi:hypothetical protein